jgi:FkbM family methyltransferase
LRELFKHIVLRYTPEVCLRYLRQVHYAQKISAAAPEPEMQVINHLVPSGGIVIDLGANFGLYTRYLSVMVGESGCVHSIEPIPSTFQALSNNVKHLGLANIKLWNRAISDCPGEVSMGIPSYERGGENFYEARILSNGSVPSTPLKTVKVTATTVDDLSRGLTGLDFIKCDVEGHEGAVLRGALETIRFFQPAWMIEVSGNPDDPESSAFQLVALLADFGYEIYRYDGQCLKRRCAGDRAVNYFFLMPHHLPLLPPTMLDASSVLPALA